MNKKQLSQKELINKAKDIAFFADEPLTQETLENMDELQKYIAKNEQKLIQQNVISKESNDGNLANKIILGESELINRNNYFKNNDWIWIRRLLIKWLVFGMFLTAIFIFLTLYIEAFRSLVSNRNFNDFVLQYLPSAQAWQNATINYKSEIVFINFYLESLYLFAFFIFFYIYFVNWKRVKVILKVNFVMMQVKQNICFKKALFFLAVLLTLVFFYILSVYLQGSQTPMSYEDYMKTSGIGLNQYEIWNTAIGLYMVVFVKGIAMPLILINMSMSVLSILLRNKFKSNN